MNGERSGCSILSGDTYLVRNYDYHPKTYDGRYVLYQPTDGGYATIGPSQRITGRMDGMNEKGLAMGYNLTNRKKPGDGFICTMIGRIILETCADVTEAVECVRAIPHRHSFSYIVYDQTDGMVVIESSPRGVEARSADACTNHFERLTEENRFNLDDSHRRLDLMKNANVQTAEDAFALLNSPAEDIFSLKYSSWSGTIHTSLYEPEKMCAWIGIGGNQTPKKFDFESWLFGTDAEGAKVHGVVDTDLPLFIWMRMQIGSAERVSVVIEVKNLSKSYKDFQAVKDSTFTVDKGEIFGFLGPNGAGKSTTINILSTMLKPTGGSVIINGYDVTKHKNKVRESIGIIFQENTLDEKLTAKENLMLHCKLYRVPRSKRKARIDEVLEIVDLTDSLNSTVEKFSGGMKRRLEIARGLLHYPKVLFLDEPSVGLDPQTRAHIWDYILKLKEKENITMFLTTHYLDEAEISDRVAIMDHGEIITIDTPKALKQQLGGDIIELTTADNARALEEIQTKFDVVDATIVEDTIHCKVENSDAFVSDFIKQLETPLTGLDIRKPTLNDVFLSFTGRAIRD